MDPTTSPLRELELEITEGVAILARTDLGYLDGAEAKLLSVLQAASDLSSLSDELEHAAADWTTRYHLTRERANAIRMLQLSENDRVLEVGAGCGAVTRYLSEVAGCVDAIEPQWSRARVAAERVRDTHARVYCGNLEAAPDQPAWDVVLVNGVLEYVAQGVDDEAIYVSFLEQCLRRLAPGGTLVVAIENRLGAKYVAGAAEDHGGLPFQGIEHYGTPAPARTFTKPTLERMLARAGANHCQALHAFPDYKTTRILFAEDALHDEALRAFAWRAPRFPSPVTGMPGARTVSERQFWRSVLEANVASSFSNSFVVLASESRDALAARWPPDLLASFCSTGRRARFCAMTHLIDRTGGHRRLVRTRLSDAPPHDRNITLRITDDVLHGGRDAAAAIAEDPELLTPLMKQWLALLDLGADSPAPIDLVPHNLVYDGDQLHITDQEWWGAIPPDVHRRRGIALLAHELADLTPPERWPDCESVGDIAESIGAEVGISFDERDWTVLLEWECQFQLTVTGLDRGRIEPALRRQLRTRPLSVTELANNRAGDVAQLNAEVTELRARIELEQQWHRDQVARAEAAEERERALNEAKVAAEAELGAIRASRGWRAVERIRTLTGRS